MIKVVVTGMGLVSSLGANLDLTWQRLLRGESSIKIAQPFAELPPQPLALVGHHPSSLAALLKPAVAEAIQDADLTIPLGDCGVVIGSSRGFQAQWEGQARTRHKQSRAYDRHNSTLQFSSVEMAYLYGASPATIVAEIIAAQGPILAPRAACATGIWAIAQGADLIREGACDRVLVGAVEAPVTPLTLAGFTQMGVLAKTGAYPFDQHRQGFVLGEGAAILILESEALARQRQAKMYGQVLGVGLTVDAHHMSTPEESRRWMKVAVNDCLDRSGLDNADIGYIHAHGTATLLNDRAEALVIQTLFPPTVAVSSTKGAMGHTLGASAALGTVFCLLALSQKILPPCVGLHHPAFELNFVREPLVQASQAVLCFSSGFGGQNAVLVLAKLDHD
jgi:3-oxoacyl-[acyl-carrier-protein] synthase II